MGTFELLKQQVDNDYDLNFASLSPSFDNNHSDIQKTKRLVKSTKISIIDSVKDDSLTNENELIELDDELSIEEINKLKTEQAKISHQFIVDKLHHYNKIKTVIG